MKPLISYYGGKQRMVKNLLPLIPEHKVYVEPFAGGASLFFAKGEKVVSNNDHYREVLNDTNQDLINLYYIVQTDKEAFLKCLDCIPYSEEWNSKAKNEKSKHDLERAVFFYVNIMMSFSNNLNGGFRFGKTGANHAKVYFNHLERLPEIINRLKGVYIFNRDALDIIKRFDSEDTFFYCDPPYPGACQGHYAGYTLENFNELVELLKTIKGSFMLSCYDCMDMTNDWERYQFKAVNSSQNTNKGGKREPRTEVVYRKLSKSFKQNDLFKYKEKLCAIG